MNYYMMVPIADLTIAMTNRSTSPVSSEMAKYKKNSDDSEYYLVEVTENSLNAVTIFDIYQWCLLDAIKTELATNWYQDED